jgi:type IV secretion system protein VirB5
MKIRTFIFMLALVAASLPALAQIPVTDGVAQGTRMQNHFENIGKWGEEIAQLKSQYDALVKQYETMMKQYNAITGIRNLGDVLNNPQFRNYMSDDWQKGFDEMGKGYNGLTNEARSLYDKYKVFDSCGGVKNKRSQAQCYSRAMKGVQDKANWTKAYDTGKARIGQIEGLMAKINDTKDAKAIAELQGRIQAEVALLQNQKILLDLQKQISDAEDAILRQQRREADAKAFSSGTSGIDYTPLTFD